MTNSCANTTTSYTSYRLSGLNNSLTYTILLVGSYSNAWNWYTWYKIGTDERSLKTDNNTTTGVTYTGISPSSGNIDIYWKDSGSGWGLMNGMVITESS